MFVLVVIAGLFFLAADYVGYRALEKMIKNKKENLDIVLWLVLKTLAFGALAYMTTFIK